MIGPDYRGEIVMAAHEPLMELGLALVAKIDMEELRAPFVKAACERWIRLPGLEATNLRCCSTTSNLGAKRARLRRSYSR